MTFLEHLAAVRRRWIYVAVGLLVGVIAGVLTAPGSGGPVDYEGVHVLLVSRGTPNSGFNLKQTALLASTGPVPDKVRQQLSAEGLRPFRSLAATADEEVGSLSVRAVASSRRAAARAADLAAQGINEELVASDRAAYDARVSAARDQVDATQAELDSVDGLLNGARPDATERAQLTARRQSLASQLATLQSQLASLQAQGPPAPPLQTLQAAVGRPATEDGWKLPESRPARGAMLGLVGLVLGVAGALAADRLDTRVRAKDDAERAFGLPVIAEIPPIPSSAGADELVSTVRPASPFVEAYRALRTVLLFTAEHDTGRATTAHQASGPHGEQAGRRSHVVLVTSPSAAEGKTTTVAHLAAVLGEFGKRTLIVSADFRRPRVHALFGLERTPGLSDVLVPGRGPVLSDLRLATPVEGVDLLPSGSPVENPAELLTETARLVGAARSIFDFIIIDTPPLLVANDATELASVADMVILMAKADRTTRDAARRATEVLQRVEAPLVGVVIAEAVDTPLAYRYYRNRYYVEAEGAAAGRATQSGSGGSNGGSRPADAPAGSGRTP